MRMSIAGSIYVCVCRAESRTHHVEERAGRWRGKSWLVGVRKKVGEGNCGDGWAGKAAFY